MGSLIRATNLWGFDDLVGELGHDPAPLLARFHIPPVAQRPDDQFLPYRNVARLLESAAVTLDCPDFGLRLSRWQGLDMLGPVAVIARNARTLGEAFALIARYLYLHCPALELSPAPASEGGDLRFEYRITESGLHTLAQSYELSMANGLRILRLLGGDAARPRYVALMHRQIGPDEAYRSAFGCPVRFAQSWCGFVVPPQLARQALDQADPQTMHLARAYLESQHPPGSASLAVQVAELIRRLLPTGQCSIDAVAEQLALHPRTLQRRLAADGERYEAVLDRERRELAARYLGESGLYLSQITGLLGYAEQSALNRSCRRWFGMTPKQFRAMCAHL